jgi:hypothetical protein
MSGIVKIFYSVLFLTPLFLLPVLITYYFKEKNISKFVTGFISGGTIGIYLNISGYFLFTKVFIADLLFHINLFMTSFIYMFIQKIFTGLLTQTDPQNVTNMMIVNSIITIIIYGLFGVIISMLVDLLKK